MNKRYVNIDDVLNLFGISDRDIYAQGTIEDALYDGTLEVYELPSTERHGKWVKWGSRYKCNQCNLTNEYKKPYCPNCGAKMDEMEETFDATQHTECVVNLYTETKLRFVLDEYIEDEELIKKILKALNDDEKWINT